jgi:hypothetical protein
VDLVELEIAPQPPPLLTQLDSAPAPPSLALALCLEPLAESKIALTILLDLN